MVRLGGAASPSYVGIFRGLQAHFLRHGIELDWVIYSNYDALVDAFARREIDLAWNAPLAYVKTKRRLHGACQVVAMRDVDVNFTTHFNHPCERGYYHGPGPQRKAGRPGKSGVDASGVIAVLFLATARARSGA